MLGRRGGAGRGTASGLLALWLQGPQAESEARVLASEQTQLWLPCQGFATPGATWHCPSLGLGTPVPLGQGQTKANEVGRGGGCCLLVAVLRPPCRLLGPSQMPLVRSVMTRAFTSFRRNSFSRSMLCVQDSLMADMRTVS